VKKCPKCGHELMAINEKIVYQGHYMPAGGDREIWHCSNCRYQEPMESTK